MQCSQTNMSKRLFPMLPVYFANAWHACMHDRILYACSLYQQIHDMHDQILYTCLSVCLSVCLYVCLCVCVHVYVCSALGLVLGLCVIVACITLFIEPSICAMQNARHAMLIMRRYAAHRGVFVDSCSPGDAFTRLLQIPTTLIRQPLRSCLIRVDLICPCVPND